jgi:hypothetical protein
VAAAPLLERPGRAGDEEDARSCFPAEPDAVVEAVCDYHRKQPAAAGV